MFGFHQEFHGRANFKIIAHGGGEDIKQGVGGWGGGFADNGVGADKRGAQIERGGRIGDDVAGAAHQFNQGSLKSIGFGHGQMQQARALAHAGDVHIGAE